MRQKSKSIATLAVHAGYQKDEAYYAIVTPITTASSFIQRDLNDQRKFCYSRVSNPTRYAYETALAEIENGIYATATASGVAATSLALELLPRDSHIIVISGVYGGTFRLFESIRKSTFGFSFSYINLNDPQELQATLQSNTKMIWIESPTNPLLRLVDIAKVCEFAKEHELITCVDNTFATAWNQQPLSLGADLVVLSTSKYINGHSDIIGGALITNREDFAAEINSKKTALGAIASPFDAYLALRGMKTLDLRMQRQCDNALKVAEFLENHAEVMEVHYPGLKSHPDYDLCKKQMRSGGAVVTIRLKGDLARVNHFIKGLQYFVLAESLGGVESMVNHSATMSHASMTPQARAEIGIYDTTLRLSVGIECIDDLIEDLTYALTQ